MVRAPITGDGITRAAVELTDELGFDKVTVSAVARRLGVKDPSLYAHIANGRELKVRVALQALEEMADEAAAALAGRAGKDALVAFGNTYRDYAKKYPGRFAAAQFELDPETAAASAGPRHSQMMRAILRGYDLGEPDQTDAVHFLGATFHGYVSLELAGGFSHTAREADASWAWALEALDLALRNHPKRNHPKKK